jgi:hypothetical protein
MTTTSGATVCKTTPDADPAAQDTQVFITYVADSNAHFATLGHTPVFTW